MKRQANPPAVIDGPAVITDEHVRNRPVSAWKGTQKAWSRLTGYERAFNKGHLLCKERCTSPAATYEEETRAHHRYAAAKALDMGWHFCQRPLAGGSDFDRVRSSGGGTPGAFADHARDTKEFWRHVEQAMGDNDWTICRMVCCQGYGVSEAVTTVSPAYKYATLVRFREALDALAEAMRDAKLLVKQPGRT